MQRITTLLLGAILLLLVGCSAPIPAATPGSNTEGIATLPANTPQVLAEELTAEELTDSSWQLTAYGPAGAETPVIGEMPITLLFDSAGQVSGEGGCNSYSGTYQVADNQVSFSQVISTLRACMDDNVTTQEQEYLQALQSSGRFERTDAGLTIWYDNEAGALNFVPAENSGG